MPLTKLDRLKHELDGAIGSEDFELAFQVVNDMLDIDPENPQFWNSKGIIMSKMDRIDEALASFDRGLELQPDDAKLWYSKGCVLMDSGEHRLALACLYKTLDLDPTFEKARERFNRCLDSWIASGGRSAEEQAHMEGEGFGSEEEAVDGEGSPDDVGEWAEEEVLTVKEEEEEEDEEASRLAEELKSKKERTGTFLDDDLFSEDGPDRKGRSKVIVEPEEGPEEEEEEEEEEEPWDDEGSEEEDMPEVKKTIKCKCGSDIKIYSDERPYRFKCLSCGRTGTLKA